jgi:flagellar hook-basal body complex protein FliE
MPLTTKLLEQKQTEQVAAESDFVNFLGQGVAEVNSLQQQSTQSVHEMLTGGDIQPSEVFASVQKADMAFRMLLQVRNKLMQAFEEVNAIRI